MSSPYRFFRRRRLMRRSLCTASGPWQCAQVPLKSSWPAEMSPEVVAFASADLVSPLDWPTVTGSLDFSTATAVAWLASPNLIGVSPGTPYFTNSLSMSPCRDGRTALTSSRRPVDAFAKPIAVDQDSPSPAVVLI